MYDSTTPTIRTPQLSKENMLPHEQIHALFEDFAGAEFDHRHRPPARPRDGHRAAGRRRRARLPRAARRRDRQADRPHRAQHRPRIGALDFRHQPLDRTGSDRLAAGRADHRRPGRSALRRRRIGDLQADPQRHVRALRAARQTAGRDLPRQQGPPRRFHRRLARLHQVVLQPRRHRHRKRAADGSPARRELPAPQRSPAPLPLPRNHRQLGRRCRTSSRC